MSIKSSLWTTEWKGNVVKEDFCRHTFLAPASIFIKCQEEKISLRCDFIIWKIQVHSNWVYVSSTISILEFCSTLVFSCTSDLRQQWMWGGRGCKGGLFMSKKLYIVAADESTIYKIKLFCICIAQKRQVLWHRIFLKNLNCILPFGICERQNVKI